MRQSWVKASPSLPSTSNRNVTSEAPNYLLKNGVREAAPIKIFRNGDFSCLSLGSAMILGAMGAVLTFFTFKGMDKYIRCAQTSPIGLCCNSILEFQLARTQTAAPIR